MRRGGGGGGKAEDGKKLQNLLCDVSINYGLLDTNKEYPNSMFIV